MTMTPKTSMHLMYPNYNVSQ